MFSQLLPFVNNMQEFGIISNNIVKIIDSILNQYNYLNKESADTIFSVINPDPSAIEKMRAENSNDKEPPDEVKADSKLSSKDNNGDNKK